MQLPLASLQGFNPYSNGNSQVFKMPVFGLLAACDSAIIMNRKDTS